MKIIKNMSLVTKIFLGLIIGGVLGVYVNVTGYKHLGFISIFGQLYIGALKSMAPLLVFVLVIDSLAGGNSSKKQSQGIKNVIILYLISSFASSALAVIASFMFKVNMPGLTATTGSTAETDLFKSITTVLQNIVTNPIDAISKGDYLPILFWATMIGISLKKVAKLSTKIVIHDISTGITKVIQGIISFAPLGVMGLVFETVSSNGMNIFIDYGKLIFLLVVVMLIVALVINPIIVAICLKRNPYSLVLKCLSRSAINAFFTRSSAANIPINLELCNELGLDKEIYSVTIPLGATINMAGAAAVITIMSLSTAWTLGMNITFGFAMAMCFLSTIAAAGTAGTAGGSLMLIPLACSLFGISVDIAWYTVGVGGTIGVIQDSVETAVNSSSDVILTATANMMINHKLGKKKK